MQGVKFSPFNSRYLASSGDSLIFWDLKNTYDPNFKEPVASKSGITNIECKNYCSEELDSEDHVILNHIGHIGMVNDFDWNHLSEWSDISASDDPIPFATMQRNNDCSMQIFRPLDLLVMDEEEAIEQMADE